MAGPLNPRSPLSDPASDLSDEGVRLPKPEPLFAGMPGAPLQMGMGAAPIRQKTVNIGGVQMPGTASVRDQIRQAYFNLTENALNQRVPLTDIRGQLKHLSKEEVNAELGKMQLDEGHALTGEENPRALDDIIKSGALNFKGEPLYYLWITKR